MGNNTISQKIDAYAQANLKALKQEEAKTGRKMTKFDIAQYMLQHGKLNKNEYANWMNTTEGFNAQAMTQQQKTALKQGSVWGFAGYGGGQESYLDSMTSFSQKTPVEKQNAISGHQMKLNETVAERKKKAAEMQKEIKQQQVTNQILNPNQALKEQKFKDHISSLPEVDATYTELMNDIKFQNMDKKQKTEFLLKTTGQKFYEAKERGDKEAMKEYLKQGIGLTFAYMDDKAGITNIKEAVKKYSGLNTVVDAIDKLVDDGDNSNLSLGEKTWETIKGAGDAVDGFIGTQGAVFMGTLAVAGEAAAAAGIGKAFALVTQAYFAYEGGTMVVDGAVDVANAQTKEEARVGGQELGTGAIMLGGAAKSVKQVRRNIKNQKAEEFVKTATSLEGEKLPTDKLMMIDSEGHPYNGIPVKRLRSGEVEMQFDTSDPVQAKMQNTLNEIKDLDAQTKAAKKADNKDLAGQLKSKAEALVTEFETQLTEFVKDKQTNNTQTAKKAYVKPEITQQRLATEEDVMSSAFEKPIWKNTVISKTARADVKYVKEQYGLDIDVLRDNKVKIGNEVFDNKQGFDKGDIAKLVKAAYSEQCKNLPSNLPEGSSELLCEIYAKKFQSNYKNAAINKLPIELKDEVSEWFDNNFKPKASIEWAGGKRYLYSSDRGTFTHSKGITYADYDAEGAANFRPMLAVKLDILAKRGYEIKLHGEDGRNDSYLSDIEITAPDGKVAHCGVFLGAVSNAIDMALQDIANGIEHPKIGR